MVGNRADSVQAEFFLQGNQMMQQKYNGNFPWNNQEVKLSNKTLSTVGPGITIIE